MKKNILYSFTGVIIGFVGVTSAAISWPPTPSGEPDSGLFMTYINKILVNTNLATTDGKVKKALDADTLGSGVVIIDSGNVGVGTNSPQAKLDINGKLKTSNIQISSSTQSGYILTSDSNGNGTWQPNNYRLKVKSLPEGNPTGSITNCVLMEDETVKCWGYNGGGQLGIGTNTSDRYLPSTLPLKGVDRLFNIGRSYYALMKDGSVYGWGYNGYGHLGLGHTSNAYIPTKITGLTAIDLYMGTPYTSDRPFLCAKIGTGSTSTAKCWGYNGYGQLGDGTTSQRNIPTDVVGLSNIKYIRAAGAGSGGHACALLNDGIVKCWGYNGYGQLGLGHTTATYVPTVVSGITDVRDLYVSDGRTCVVLNDNVTLKCWGLNNYGQLGDGTTTQKNSPVTISAGGNAIKEVIMSKYDYYSTWVVFNDGTVKSCGYNGYGQLGHGDTTQRTGLVQIPGLSNVKEIKNSGTGSYGTTCALLNDGTVKCWGRNGTGQLGVGDTTNRYTPTTVVGIENAVDINSFGWSNNFNFSVLLSDGSMMMWGRCAYGMFGQGDNLSYYIPVKVKNLNTD